MNFKELMRHLEHRLGHHQVPVNASATCIHDLFESAPLHQQLMTRLATAIYKQNRCAALDAPVTRAATFEAIVPIRLEVLRARDTDVDLFRLIEDLCSAIGTAFGPDSSTVPPQDAPHSRSEVIPFTRSRKLRSLA